MKELYELVLKTIEESDESRIFFASDYVSDFMTSRPVKSFNRRTCALTNSLYSELSDIFYFFFKFTDGNPNVEVVLDSFEITEKETLKDEIVGSFWSSRIIKGKNVPTKSYPIYKISAGELEYLTTVEESRKLHKAYDNLIERDKNSVIKKQEQQIKDRLSGKVKLDLND